MSFFGDTEYHTEGDITNDSSGFTLTHNPVKKHKDSVFRDLFSIKENSIALCRALLGDNTITDVEDVTLQDVIFSKCKNDLAFRVGDRYVIILIEHQATVNYNMPVRFLTYMGRIYEKLLENENKYARRRIVLDAPLFFVLYNGNDDVDAVTEMRLSDSFRIKNDNLELKVAMYNLNKIEDLRFLKNCNVLNEYNYFIENVREEYEFSRDLTQAISFAIKKCMDSGILVQYLKSRGSEVNNMLLTEYDDELARKVAIREGREEGREQGIQQGREEGIQQGRTEAKIAAASNYVKRKYTGNNSDEVFSDLRVIFNLTKDEALDLLKGSIK